MLLTTMLGDIRRMKGNFEHLVHESWSRMYEKIVLKVYKKQMRYENHDICQDLVISYVEDVI